MNYTICKFKLFGGIIRIICNKKDLDLEEQKRKYSNWYSKTTLTHKTRESNKVCSVSRDWRSVIHG